MGIVKNQKQYKVASAKDMGDFVKVKIKDEESILIPLEDYFMMSIKINSILTEDVYEKYKEYQTVYQAYMRIKNRIYKKDYTMLEIKNYCKRNLRLDDQMTDIVLDMIFQTKLVDDHAYALDKSSYYQDIGYSMNEIRFRLQKVGIQDTWIDEAIFALSYEKEEINAKKYLKKILNTVKGKSIAQTKITLINKLMSNGFSYDLSKTVVDAMSLKEDDNALILTYNKAKRLYAKENGYKRLDKIRTYCIRKGFSLSQVNEIMEGEEND